MIETISPLMRQALDQGRTLLYFVVLWLSVASKTIETEDDFLACDSLVNVDYDSEPGTAKIAIGTDVYTKQQLTEGSSYTLETYADFTVLGQTWHLNYYKYAMQKIILNPARKLTKITVKVDNSTGAAGTVYCEIFKGSRANVTTYGWRYTGNFHSVYEQYEDPYSSTNKAATFAAQITAGYSGNVVFNVDCDLLADLYWMSIRTTGTADSTHATGCKLKYTTSTTAYADGPMDVFGCHFASGAPTQKEFDGWSYSAGSMYFALEFNGYEPDGMRILSDTKDMGEVPIDDGVFTASYEQPLGTSVTFNLYASTTGAFAGEETAYLNVDDGFICPAGFRYWKIEVVALPNAEIYLTPRIESLTITFPVNPLRLREKDRPLRYADKSLLDFQPLLSTPSFEVSEVDTTERVSTGGSASFTLHDPQGDAIRRILADHPLKNYRYMLYLGADLPGFGEDQLLRWSVGTVASVGYKPKYRRETTELSLTLENSILQLTQKAPIAGETGLVSAENVSIDYDNVHVMDAMVDLIRGKAGIEPRYVNVQSFLDGKTAIGDADGPASLYRIRRGYHATLPDTRIKSPDEVRTFLKELCLIADGYIGIDETSRIYFFKHDKTGASVATWADEKLVRQGYAAVPIEDISDIDLGYDSRIYTACMMGYGWTGSNDDKWENFTRYCYIDADAADEWSMGDSVWINLMEKNLKAASKWLGPESYGYPGETICRALTKRYVDRFKYPPMLLKGVRVHQREFVRNMGDVIHIRSDEIARFKKRRIPDGDSTNFMIVKKSPDRDNCRAEFDLVELT